MLDLLAVNLFSLLISSEQVPKLQTVDWAAWRSPAWIVALKTPEKVNDPTAIAATQRHLNSLAAVGMPPGAQGVWLQSGNQILAEHQGTRPIPAASLTKIATTLAALETWQPTDQFETVAGVTGELRDGVVQGDLVIQGGGDPLFVWEEAIALGNALAQAGIVRVAGNLVITGKFSMNFKADPGVAGHFLKRGLNADLWNSEINTQYAALPAGTPKPRIVISGEVQVAPTPPSFRPVVRRQSLPLIQILKAMNIFSNNHIADSVAQDLGGGAAIAQKAAAAARIPPEEIRLINGSGLGEENQISPRAVVAMLMTLQQKLQAIDLSVADVLPVIGRERGTLGGRQIIPGAAVKTGTLNRVSSLAGVIPTRDRGLVWFSILDIGTADLKALHNLQDELLQTLVNAWGEGSPVPPDLQPSDRIPSYQQVLGDPGRNQVFP